MPGWADARRAEVESVAKAESFAADEAQPRGTDGEAMGVSFMATPIRHTSDV